MNQFRRAIEKIKTLFRPRGTKEMQGKYKGNAEKTQRNYKGNTKGIQQRNKWNTNETQRERKEIQMEYKWIYKGL